MKSKGVLSKHVIRKPTKSIITEVAKPSTHNEKPSTIKKLESNSDVLLKSGTISKDDKGVIPSYELIQEPNCGIPEFLAIRVSLPKLVR